LTAARAIAGNIRCAAIVGHNPCISDLANLLTRQKEYRLAPLEALCLDVTTPWIDLGSSPLRVTRFVEPNKAKP
jgi:phosphohistidine phosphatase SixA